MNALQSLKYIKLSLNRCYARDIGQIPSRWQTTLTNEAVRKKRCKLFDEELARQRSFITRVEKIEVKVKGPPQDCTLIMNKDISTPYNCTRHLSEFITSQSALARVNGRLWDMHSPLKDDCTLQLLNFKQEDPTELNKVFWRSCSFLMGMLVERGFRDEFFIELHSWPGTNIRSGCFIYDADIKMKDWVATQTELQVFSTIMRRLCKQDLPFQRLEVDVNVALEIFQDNRFKTKQIPEIAEKSKTKNKVTLYRVDDHIDISRGPMIGNVNQINNFTVCATHKVSIGEYDLYRFQGMALPTQIMMNRYAIAVLAKRASKLQKFVYNTTSDFEDDVEVRFIVGQAGVLEVLAQFFLAYLILVSTVLSISAISSNGAVEGGGVYYMISRTLGPEFGGSIGTLFFFANIFSCGLYITGCVEGLIDNFAQGGTLANGNGLPQGHWWGILYASIIAIFNLIVCLIGASMFAKTSLIIFFVVIISMSSVVIHIPETNKLVNRTFEDTANYTGLRWDTFHSNIFPNYGPDYTSDNSNPVNFASVFGVLFSGVTGIMAGANMSGDLKEPSTSIPKGTLCAVAFTAIVYIVLSLMTAGSCTNFLLHNDYLYMQSINLWQPFVAVGIFAATLSASLSALIGASRVLEAFLLLNNYTFMQDINFTPWLVVIGMFAATLSAALSNLIGASRVLEALAKDNLFGILLRPVARGVFKGNPIFAVFISYLLVQVTLLIGSLNKIAQITSVLFLLSYCATNIACLALELASAPNFRPSFKYFSWHTCIVGFGGTLAMMFVINAIYAACCIIACLLLIIALHLRSPVSNWGSISQALIFHQVRKYLLLLDSRKDHVKFWRPQMLLMVTNPRTCVPLIAFVNDLKKSGLYVLGNVKVGSMFDIRDKDPVQDEYLYWLKLIDHLKVKAFVELIIANSVREGMHNLIRISGLGAMKPNTIIFGFYDDNPQEDFLIRPPVERNNVVVELGDLPQAFRVREADASKQLYPSEYVSMVADAILLQKNVCLCRHFHLLDKTAISKSRNLTIDVWPVNFFQPDKHCLYDTTSLFVMQLACILNMVSTWRKKTTVRVVLCMTNLMSDSLHWEKQIEELLRLLRIEATISVVVWDDTFALYPYSDSPDRHLNLNKISQQYIESVNELICNQSVQSAVSFFYLCAPPSDDDQRLMYLRLLELMTNNLPPTVLVHGISPVTTTTL
uniref:Solute carrier family 12 member 9 n=1 Tax=Strigamia maritima TaxID=126957 RepID=T1J674_STRMM